MPKWFFALLLLIQAHFSASYLVPLDEEAQETFGGLLRWAWPWSNGDSGPLGEVTATSGVPFSGFLLAATGALLLILAALAVFGLWVPASWWRVLAIAGAALSLVLMAFFPDFTKLLPIALALFIIWGTSTNRVSALWPVAVGD